MNKKNLNALFDGLTAPARPQEVRPADTSPTLTSSKVDNAERPKEERFCTIVNSEVLRKIRLIATREGLQIKDVVNAAFAKAVNGYEQKHGKIEEHRKDTSNLF